MEVVKIFNISQAQTFIREGLHVVDCGVGKRSKVYITFTKDERLDELMERWRRHEFFIDNGFKDKF